MGELNSNIAPVELTARVASGITINQQHCYRIGKIVVVNLAVTIGNTAISSGGNIAVIDDCPPAKTVPVVGQKNLGGGNSQAYFGAVGTLGALYNDYDSFAANSKYFFNFTYVMA